MNRTARVLTARARLLISKLAWLMVLVNLWNAPLPWLHRHTDQPQLNQHLLTFHLPGSLDLESSNGTAWHMHFVLFEDILSGQGCPVPDSEPQPEDVCLPYVSTEALTETLLPLLDEIPPAVPRVLTEAVELERFPTAPLHAFERYSSAIPLLTRLCVARC